MDKLVRLLKEGEENLLKKLTDDENKNYLKDSISVLSIQKFREDNIGQEVDKDDKRDL